MAEQILDVLVPEMVEQLVKLPKTESDDRTQQWTAEHIAVIPVPQGVKELVVVFRVFSQDRILQRTVEQIIPATSLAEMIVEVPANGRKDATGCEHARSTRHTVEVEKPKIIELTVQRKKFIIQEKINQGTKPIEFPQAQFLDKAGNMPVVVQRQVSTAQTVQKAMEVPPLQSVNRVVDIPVVAQRQIYMKTVQKSIETLQLQYCDDAIDVPVVLVVQAPLVQVMMKTVQIPQLPYIEKIAVIPEIRTVRGPQTSESLSIDSKGLNHQDCEVLFHVNKQSPDIAGGVHVDRDVIHAGNGARTAAAAQHRST